MTMSRVVTVPKCRVHLADHAASRGCHFPAGQCTSGLCLPDRGRAIVRPARRRTSTTLPVRNSPPGRPPRCHRPPQGPTLYREITALCAHRSELVEGLLEVPYEITFLGAGTTVTRLSSRLSPCRYSPLLESAESADSADSVDSARVRRRCRRGASQWRSRSRVPPTAGPSPPGLVREWGGPQDLLEFQAQGPTWTRCTADRAVALIGICPGNFRVLCMR